MLYTDNYLGSYKKGVFMAKIISYNLNGIRAAIKKGFIDWVKSEDFDVICIQETKAHSEQVDLSELEALGYHAYWHSAQKKGYSGVLTLSKQPAKDVAIGCGIEPYDNEGRIIRTDFGTWSLLNCYFPSGTSGEERQNFKYAFLDDFYNWINELKQSHPNLLIVGDYNIAHTEMDIHNPKGNKKSSGFLPEERAWLSKWFENGFTDAYRYLNPEKIEYSWWSFRANARANNKGWRIDYQSVTEPLKKHLKEAYHLNEVVHSDHCPVYVELDAPMNES